MRFLRLNVLLPVCLLSVTEFSFAADAEPVTSGFPSTQTTSTAPRNDSSTAAGIELGREYTEYNKTQSTRAGTSAPSYGRRILSYFESRILDLLDIFRLDLGIGPSAGASIKLTKWGQLSYREIAPFSARMGLRGRKLPFFIEQHDEKALAWTYYAVPDRTVCPLETGVGVDVLLGGAYAGICGEEVLDFLLGILGIDMMDDDVR